MESGRQVLHSLDAALDRTRREFQSLDGEMRRITAALAETRQRELGACRELARIRLDQIDHDAFIADADEADRRAAGLLEQRAARIDELSRTTAELNDRLEALAAERRDAAAEVEARELRLQELIDSVQAALRDDPGYRENADETQRTVDMAARAEQKTAQAEEDRRDKGKPYESDKLFMYLWRRGYGTERYSAGLIARWMDGIVARHIRFEPARRNYYLLNEIPLRLARHTERLEARAAELMTALAEQERTAEVAAGAEALEDSLAAAQSRAGELDEKIAAAEAAYAERVREQETYAVGSDALFTEAIEILTRQFASEPIPQLRAEADATADYSDDQLVADLAGLRDSRRSLERRVEDNKAIHGRRLDRVNDLAAVRRRYKESGFDSAASVIEDRGNVELMLNEYLRGTVSADRLWRVIRHSQRFVRRMRRSRLPGGGLGGVRIPRMPRGIRIPRGLGGSGGFKVPRMPGGGGFRTKGGF